MKRRAVLAGVPTALLLGGCTDLLSDGEVTFEADTAVVAESALSETGYEEQRVEDQEITREYEQIDRTVVVVNRLAEYADKVSIAGLGGELARFTVLATPKVEVGPVGPLNPVDDMDNDELAEMVQEEYDTVDNLESVDSRQATLLGESAEVTKFRADAETEAGESVEVFIHIAKVESGDDFVLAIGVHPRDIDERENVDTMMAGVEHDGGSGDGDSDGNESA